MVEFGCRLNYGVWCFCVLNVLLGTSDYCGDSVGNQSWMDVVWCIMESFVLDVSWRRRTELVVGRGFKKDKNVVSFCCLEGTIRSCT